MRFILRDIFTGLRDLFYPPVCGHCQRLITTDTAVPLLCNACLRLLKPLPGDVIHEAVLDKLPECVLDDLWAAFQFDEVIQQVVHGFKYQQMPRLAGKFGEWVKKSIELPSFAQTADLVIPVPLHKKRIRQRGYNQVERIARSLFPVEKIDTGVLRRSRHTPSQTKLKRSERQQNVRNAFVVNDPGKVAGKRIVLVDDIVTTGATLNECAAALKKSGVAGVAGVALASPVFFKEKIDMASSTI